MADMAHRPLGDSGLSVSVMSLGSWRTYERLDFDDALAVVVAALDAGIDFLDDARYDDETGAAPIPTGWSEVLFGELLRASGWPRDEVTIANKLWWEHWPAQSATAELDASLGRMELDHVDLIYAMTLPDGLAVDDAVEQVAALVTAGRARAWGVANWRAEQIAEARAVAADAGLPAPCAAQLPYSLVGRGWVECDEMADVLSAGDVGLVASYALAGGTLTGKYLRGERGRADATASNPVVEAGLAAAAELDALAREWEIPSAQLAFAFALDHPALASVLFGATDPEQLAVDVGSLAVHDALDDDQRARLRQVGAAR